MLRSRKGDINGEEEGEGGRSGKRKGGGGEEKESSRDRGEDEGREGEWERRSMK